MKDKETPFQAAFEKQNFDNFIARMGTFPAHGARTSALCEKGSRGVNSIDGLQHYCAK